MSAWRVLGIGMLLFCGLALSFLWVARERRRFGVLVGWAELIDFIRGQIDCFLSPMDEILAAADPALLHACGLRGDKVSLSVLLEASRADLGREAERLLAAFVRECGGGYREEQVKRCDYYIAALRRLCERYEKELPQRLRLGTTLCLCATAGLLILLW